MNSDFQRSGADASGMATGQPELAILKEISGLSERIRVLRRMDAGRHKTHIKAAELELRTKWDEVRMVRSGSLDPVAVPHERPRLRRRLESA